MIFFFTDIEGSTARWEAYPSAMPDAVARHDRLVSDAIRRHDGRVFKTVGDAFCAAFADARDAVTAAHDVQRALSTEDWSAIDGMRVRVALHAGDAVERDGDYFGPNVNRVARLLSTGHGGQVLLSSSAASLVNGRLPESFDLIDLGVHRLKDLNAPEHVYQLAAPDLAQTFKPLLSLDSFSHNLPRQTTSFVGREEDLAHLKALLAQAPLVSIVGTGGVGKTRLALQAAADTLDERRSAWFVNLAPVSDPSLVAGTVLAAMRVPELPNVPPIDTLVAYLRDRSALVVLDNCEHLIDEVAEVASALIERCPAVTVLATTREPLNVPGERTYRLPALEGTSAVELFIDRAKNANNAFMLGEGDRAIVEEICDRLDGIALAIELAASRVRMLSIRALAERLDERFKLLTGGARTALPRQQTLHALIDWSYDLLSPSEQRLFRRLAIFRGSFDIEAATGVCADETLGEREIFELLTALVDKSLLNADATENAPRYHFLQTIQEYADERLSEADEAHGLARRHADLFASRARAAYEEWDRDPRPHWLQIFAPDLDNFRAALAWSLGDRNAPETGGVLAASAMPIFLRLSLLREATAWSERALAQCPLEAPIAARLQYGLSMLYNNQGALKPALAAAEHASALYRELDDERGLARALGQVAQQLARQGRGSEAISIASEAIARARATGDKRLLATTLQRSAIAYDVENIAHARELFEESASLFRALGRTQELCRALAWWADAEAAAGCTARALELSSEALRHDPGDTEVFLTVNVASFYLQLADSVHAAAPARKGFALARQTAHPILEPIAMSYLAVVAATASPQDAARLFGYARARFSALEFSPTPEAEAIYGALLTSLRSTLSTAVLDTALSEGAALSDDDARSIAARV